MKSEDCAAAVAVVEAAGKRAEWGSPAKSSLTCSRQKSRAGADPTDCVRSSAMTHLHSVTPGTEIKGKL